MNKIKLTAIATLILFSVGCSKDDDNSTPQSQPITPVGDTTAPFQELYDQGVDKYLGVFTPSSSQITSPGTTEHIFSGIDNPICFTGNQFSMFTRDGSENNLLIFLQGGGFCTPIACDATETGIPLIPFGILNPNDPQNPLANYNLGYVPYCDGSGMMGDTEADSDRDGVNDRFFSGLKNLSASLEVISKAYPSPGKIVLAGNSAGGFAVHAALPLLRKLYPNVKIYIINDSGIGIAQPMALQSLFNYWNATFHLPASCGSCIGTDGNLTEYHRYQLAEDDNISMAYISSKQDSTISVLSGGGAAFEAQLIEATIELDTAYSKRFQGLIGNGDFHTTIIRDFNRSIGTTTVSQWVTEMVAEDDNWTTIIE